jgi:hypothetical protein
LCRNGTVQIQLSPFRSELPVQPPALLSTEQRYDDGVRQIFQWLRYDKESAVRLPQLLRTWHRNTVHSRMYLHNNETEK